MVLATAMICAKCKQPSFTGRGLLLRPGAKKKHIVCHPCYDRVMTHRAKKEARSRD